MPYRDGDVKIMYMDNNPRSNKNKCLFPVTRPILENCPDPRFFFKLKKHRKTLYFYRVLSFCVKTGCFDQSWHINENNITVLLFIFCEQKQDFPSNFANKNLFCLKKRLRKKYQQNK